MNTHTLKPGGAHVVCLRNVDHFVSNADDLIVYPDGELDFSNMFCTVCADGDGNPNRFVPGTVDTDGEYVGDELGIVDVDSVRTVLDVDNNPKPAPDQEQIVHEIALTIKAAWCEEDAYHADHEEWSVLKEQVRNMGPESIKDFLLSYTARELLDIGILSYQTYFVPRLEKEQP